MRNSSASTTARGADPFAHACSTAENATTSGPPAWLSRPPPPPPWRQSSMASRRRRAGFHCPTLAHALIAAVRANLVTEHKNVLRACCEFWGLVKLGKHRALKRRKEARAGAGDRQGAPLLYLLAFVLFLRTGRAARRRPSPWSRRGAGLGSSAGPHQTPPPRCSGSASWAARPCLGEGRGGEGG